MIVFAVLVFAGFLWYREWKIKQRQGGKTLTTESSQSSSSSNANGDEENIFPAGESDLDEEEQDFNAQCESGEWQKIADVQGETATASGKLRRIYPDDESAKEFAGYQYFVEGKERIPVGGSNLSKLDYFEDREVEIEGVKSVDGRSINASRVRCAGVETDKNIIVNRTKLMNWLAANINSVAPRKAPYRKWTVDIVDFVNENNLYVEYYDTIEDDGNSDVSADTSRKILLEVSPKSDGNYNSRVLAYWEMGEDDYVLKSGTDKFEDVEDTYSYQYDPEEKSWSRI